LTRFTTLYFFFALLNCIVLVILQGVAYADNSEAVHIIEGLLSGVNVTKGLPVFSGGVLYMCDSLPGQPGTVCNTVVSSKAKRSEPSLVDTRKEHWSRIVKKDYDFKTLAAANQGSSSDPESSEEIEEEEDQAGTVDLENAGGPTIGGSINAGPTNGGLTNSTAGSSNAGPFNDVSAPAGSVQKVPDNIKNTPTSPASSQILDVSCAQTLIWLEDVMEDGRREDIVALFFNVWLFSLAVVTILNESLPHLGASLVGYILGMACAAFRVASTEKLWHHYESLVVNGACQANLMGGWWNFRKVHTLPILAFNVVALITMAYLSFMLFKVYASQSFGRVGASSQVNRTYKIVLVFSACLQLTAFFSLASTAMWIDHICDGIIWVVAHHRKLYLAAFIVTLLLLLPWLLLGWLSVRKECRKRYLVFSGISVFLVAVSTLMFASPLYRFTFMSWPFFATITVTAFVLIVTTTMLGLWCRFNFGRGLAHFLQVSDALEGVDFTPVYFNKDAEKGNMFNDKLNDSDPDLDEKYPADVTAGYIQQPELSYKSASKSSRGQSVYSERSGIPVKLSSTPSLFQERDRAATRAASTRWNKAFGGNLSVLGRDGYAQPRMPSMSATPSTRSRASDRSRDLTLSSQSSFRTATRPSALSRSVTPPATSSRPGLPANPRVRPPKV